MGNWFMWMHVTDEIVEISGDVSGLWLVVGLVVLGCSADCMFVGCMGAAGLLLIEWWCVECGQWWNVWNAVPEHDCPLECMCGGTLVPLFL